MNPTSRHTMRTKLRGLLEEAAMLERSRIGQDGTHTVQDLIDHNEFGLAREQLIDALAELDLTPLQRTNSLLSEAERLMQLPA